MRSTIPSLPICSVLSRLFFTWFKSFPLTVTSVYLDMEMVATKGNSVEARTLWSHTDSCCSTCLPTGNGTKAESHSPMCPTFWSPSFHHTELHFSFTSTYNNNKKKKERKSTLCKFLAQHLVSRVPTQATGSIPCMLLQRQHVHAVPPVPKATREFKHQLLRSHSFFQEKHIRSCSFPKSNRQHYKNVISPISVGTWFSVTVSNHFLFQLSSASLVQLFQLCSTHHTVKLTGAARRGGV